MSDRRATLQEVIRAAVEAGLRQLYTCIPAKVVKWDASNGRADCQILIKDVNTDEEDTRVVTSAPIVTGVPVQFPGAGGYRVTFPISDGSTVIDGSTAAATMGTLMFSHRSLDKWLTGKGDEVDPELDHDHAPNDAIFVPGLLPFGSFLSSCPTDHATIGADGGQQIHFHSGTIVAGDEATAQFVAMANLVKQWLDAFNTAVSGWIPVPQDGGAALKAALATLIAGTPSTSVAGSVLKAKP